MHVVITTQVYAPETHPTAVMVRQLALALEHRGHVVSVATGYPNHPTGRLFPEFRMRLAAIESGEVTLIRVAHLITGSSRVLPRATAWASQALAGAIGAAIAPSPDVVVNFGPPLAGPLLARAVAGLRGARVVSVVYDLYPDAAVTTGHIRNRLLVLALRQVARFGYDLSDRIVVLSNGFRDKLIEDGVDPQKVDVVPVWLDGDEITPGDRLNGWRASQGIADGARVVLYAGTIGEVAGAQVVLDAARQMAERPDVQFLFVGGGRQSDHLRAMAVDMGLTNTTFLPFQDRIRLSDVQATSDLSIVTLAAGAGTSSVPSKVVGYLAAGRPIVASVDLNSDTAECVLDADGIVVPPGDGASLALEILRVFDDEPRRVVRGQRARALFDRDFSMDSVLARLCGTIESTGEAPRTRMRARRSMSSSWARRSDA